MHNSGAGVEISYWRDCGKEVDFILRSGKSVVALEVKSILRKESLPGLAAFGKLYPAARKLTVGDQGIPVEEFLLTPAPRLIG